MLNILVNRFLLRIIFLSLLVTPYLVFADTNKQYRMDDCEIFDGYQIGMTVDAFKSLYVKRYGNNQALSNPAYNELNGERWTVYTVPVSIDSVSVIASFTFAEHGLGMISGEFDPSDFRNIRESFIRYFGSPDKDGLNYIDAGKAFDIWKTKSKLVFVNQIAVNKNAGSITISADINDTKLYEACGVLVR